MVKKIQITLSNKVFYSVICIVAVIAILGIAYAYNADPTVPTNPPVMGHTADEIDIIVDGNPVNLIDYINGFFTASPVSVTCSNPIFDSYTRGSGTDLTTKPTSAVVVNDTCKDSPCVIKEEFFDKTSTQTSPKATLFYDYRQTVIDNKNDTWQGNVKTGTNGDGVAIDVVPIYPSSTSTYRMRILDDLKGTEVDEGHWTIQDGRGDMAMKVYICQETA